MNCPSCQAQVLGGKRFCVECGAPMPLPCPSCGNLNPQTAKFCGDCGAKLDASTTSAPRPAPSRETAPKHPTSPAERRQLTVMFCDLVGSTALSSRLDPEDIREVIGAYHRCIAEVVGRFEGFVAKYMGDGVLVYFGWPHADEADAERAVRAALATLEAIAQVAPTGERLAVRIGLATGLAVIGDLLGIGAAQEQAVVGETPNLAARLQSLAEPGWAVIDAETRRRIGGLFDCRELGAVHLKGLPGPLPAWQVLGEAVVQSRFEAMHPASLAPLVGREDEFDLLLHRWRRAKEGEGQVVLISGEPGIGKSRLIAELEERVFGGAAIKLKYFCSPHHRDSALQPIIARWENEAGFVRGEPADARLDKLEALLLPFGATQNEVALIAEMLGVPGGERYPPLNLSPQGKKEHIFAALKRILAIRTRRSPVLMLFEDAHWADPSSLELLDRTIEQLAGLPVLLIISYRPEFQAPWVGHADVSLIALSRLNPRQSAALASQIVVGQTLPAGMLGRIVAQTDGVPLFIEELTKTVLEGTGRANAAASALPVPSTLRASLMARLDRLPAAKQVAQIGAAIGREFGQDLLSAIAGLPEATLTRGLDDLVSAGLAFRRGTPPEATYLFKHALVQDAAYASLLRGTRQELHVRIARFWEERFPEVALTQPELLAHHSAEGGLIERAVDYWFAAGERALHKSANVEAIKHLSRGIQLLMSLPDTPERQRKELRFQTTLGLALTATKGWAAPEVAQAYSRADELCQALNDSVERFKIVLGLWNFHAGRGETHRARELSDELFRLAEQQDDDELRLQAHHSVWGSVTWHGEFTVSREHIEQGMAMYSPAKHGSHALIYGGHDPGVCGWVHGGVDLWFLGYPDQAAEHVRRSVLLAEEIAHPPSLGHALHFGLLCHQLRGDEATVRVWGERLAELAAEHGLGLYKATAIAAGGWVLANQGQAKSSLLELRQGLDAYTDLGFHEFEPYFQTLLAKAHLNAGEAAIGLEVLEDAMRFAEESGVRFWSAELLRLKGDLLAHLSPDGERREVEAFYREALTVAGRQQARSLELRGATSLARLWRDQGKCTEAHDLLAPIYGWFTEGVDTPDLKEAKALLDELCE